MAALTADIPDLLTRDVTRVQRYIKAATAVYAGGLLMKDSSGDVLPLSTSAGVFEGIGLTGVGASATARYISVVRKGALLVTLTGVTKADYGKPVYCTTDNLADATLTFASGAKLIGFVTDLEFNSLGAIANKAWVAIDVDAVQDAKVLDRSAGILTLVGTAEDIIYRAPTGRKATILALSYEYDAKPNYATSAALAVQKITGTTRTTALDAASVDVNNTSVVADTVTALALTATAADLALAAGDRLVMSVAAVGTQTAAGNVKVHAIIAESDA